MVMNNGEGDYVSSRYTPTVCTTSTNAERAFMWRTGTPPFHHRSHRPSSKIGRIRRFGRFRMRISTEGSAGERAGFDKPNFPTVPHNSNDEPEPPAAAATTLLHVFPDESRNAFYLFATQKQDPPQKGTHTHDFKRVALLPFVERKDAGESSLKSRILAGVFDVLSTTEYRLRRENDKKARDRFQESWQKALERSDELKFNQDDDEFDLMRFGRDDRREG
ncbi:hypothetical protein BLNAU_24012 [Blattamonas nauphoetae]|uniref:Uncharacterized protein n=1 Tax=Blattamonas nauphoetae TaxID=2049346 RepID=A0ABQ9WNL2_9EUKA|nr:hypothetical protein BLNAU_24012 [Blattamonas nauphoetae]